MAVTAASSWKRSHLAHKGKPVAGLREVFSSAGSVLANRAFLPVFAAFLLIAMGRTMNSTLALPYYKDSLGLSELQIQGAVLSTFTLCIILAIPAWVLLGRYFGKKRPAFMGIFGLGIMTIIAYPLFPRDSLGGPVLAAILGGFLVGAIILVESLITDIADEDFAKHGEPREGLYFGIWRMGQKMARSLTLGLSGSMLALIGYEESLLQQSASTARALAWVFGLGVGGLFLAAGLVFLQTPQFSGIAVKGNGNGRGGKFLN